MKRGTSARSSRLARRWLVVPIIAVLALAMNVGVASASWWKPPAKPTWYWQLSGTINNNREVEIYDLDYEETTKKEVTTLHEKGRHVICYVDVGGAEKYRSDYEKFTKLEKEGVEIMGEAIEGWPEERWINIRELKYVEPIEKARFETCASKGFDAVEIDEDEAWLNETAIKSGPITAAQQLAYNKWLAETIHSLGMAVFQKNDGSQTKEQVSLFDGAIAEQCNENSTGPYSCGEYVPYVEAGKPVLSAEYGLTKAKFCANDEKLGFMGARFNLALNGNRFEPCW
ncbi:MAG: endo alpha-1,4 polygalactosaminidase [Actinobacteria bacterium]|nr:endo alpha-1,4 polygalactosaminidase [Actinomycetota bacterium]